jgi:hypothetical protein
VYSGVAFVSAGGASWSNPAGALSNDPAAATVSGSTAPLFLRHDQASYRLGEPDYADRDSVDYYQVTIRGSGTAAAESDRTIEVALTVDSVTPATPWKEQALATTEAAYTFGSSTAIDLWQATGARPLSRPDITVRTGTVNTAGSVVTYASGAMFNLRWGAGSKITINGAVYTIASVDHEQQITLTSPAGSQSNVAYKADNFGVLVRKKTASGDTIRVQYASVTYQTSVAMSWPASGVPM